MLPRWRSFREAQELGELAPDRCAVNPTIDPKPFIEQKASEWLANKSLPFAVELVSASTVLGPSPHAESAATFILESRASSSTAKALACSLLGVPEVRVESGAYNSRSEIQSALKLQKEKRLNQPRSAFVWLELARLYTLLGQLDPAKQAMRVALTLAPNERFTLRSASRFLVHAEEPDRALNLLRLSPRTPLDPWLVAAELAVSSILSKRPKFFKSAKEMVGSKSFSPFHLTELLCAVASIEMTSGADKKANKLFNAALDAPTDNSLAQVVWAGKKTGLGMISERYFSIPHSHEAQTFQAQNLGNWSSLVASASDWARDEFFSARPRLLASSTATSLLNDPNLGEQIARIGLETNPKHPGLINNLAFSLCHSGKAEEALQCIKTVDDSNCSPVDKICLRATEGLAQFRIGNPLEGNRLYQEAIHTASEHDLEDMKTLATLYLSRERILGGDAGARQQFLEAAEKVSKSKNPRLTAITALLSKEIIDKSFDTASRAE